MKDAKVWLRLGDNAEYESYDTPYEAGQVVGQYTPDRKPVYVSKGVTLEGFQNHNYISLFWGDDEAQPVDESDLNTSDKLDFELGLAETI